MTVGNLHFQASLVAPVVLTPVARVPVTILFDYVGTQDVPGVGETFT